MGGVSAGARALIINVAPALPDGRYDIELPNTPLTCIAIKESDRPARVVISRPIQDDETLPQRVGHQITRKLKKLCRYKADGYSTVLILETQDQSLMNQHKMLEAVREGLGGSMPEGLDQLWFTEARGRTSSTSRSRLERATTSSTDSSPSC